MIDSVVSISYTSSAYFSSLPPPLTLAPTSPETAPPRHRRSRPPRRRPRSSLAGTDHIFLGPFHLYDARAGHPDPTIGHTGTEKNVTSLLYNSGSIQNS
jgi:hypothetical protein